MTLTQFEMVTVAAIVQEHCERQAPHFRAHADEALGAVFEKIIDNLGLKSRLDKPLEHYAHATAFREARRFFLRQRPSRPLQKREG